MQTLYTPDDVTIRTVASTPVAIMQHHGDPATIWTCAGFVPVSDLDYAAFASKARGLMLPRYEWRRREL